MPLLSGDPYTDQGGDDKPYQWSTPTEVSGKSKRAEPQPKQHSRSTSTEIGFCFSMAITQFIAEYLISGFSVLLPAIEKQSSSSTNTTSNFWPASILSLILCCTILTFARASDMYGGHPVFMAAIAWLCIWTFVAGFSTHSIVLLDVCRAMQGLAIAAYTPSSFTMFGFVFPAGPKRNIALGIYGACAPLGFFAGISVSAALSDKLLHWYFWIAAALSLVTLITAYASIPTDRTDRSSLHLSMDWGGAITITSGLILVLYALYSSSKSLASWGSTGVMLPFISGVLLLLAAAYIETYVAKSPLLPLDFFTPKNVKSLSLACLFFYGCFGVWLFTSTSFLETTYSVHGIKLAAWYVPMAVGGFLIATTSGTLLHRIPPTLLLLGSGCAWICAPLLLAVADKRKGYWAFPFPSMLCATMGIDITFTISIVFFSSVSPLKYQGLAGAMSSILVNMGIASSLALAQIVENSVRHDDINDPLRNGLAHRAAFWFATGSAGFGVALVVLFVRIPKAVLDEQAPSPMKELSVLSPGQGITPQVPDFQLKSTKSTESVLVIPIRTLSVHSEPFKAVNQGEHPTYRSTESDFSSACHPLPYAGETLPLSLVKDI